MAWKLPDGYRLSNLLPEHEQGAVDVFNAFWLWMNGGSFTTLEEMQGEWADPILDREQDIRVVVSPKGQVVGYMDVVDFTALHVRMFSWLAILPEEMGQGIEDVLVDWAVQRGIQRLPQASEGARVVLHMGANADNQDLYQLYTRHGFQPVRYSYRMRIDMNGAAPTPAVPAGITIRPMLVGKEEREAIYTTYDAFRDHWGFVEEPFEKYCENWMHHLKTDPNYDPAYYFVAMDGSEMAGVSLCYPKFEEVPEMGWVGTLAVRRPWRKRGLGLALLQHSFSAFHELGKASVGLGVDAQNLTGALRLYEKAGMRVWRKNCTYEFELRPGKDLMKQNLE